MSGTAPTADRGPIEAAVAAVKPRLRGWIHAGTFPLALAAGIVLVALAPTEKARLGAAVFAVTATLLFGTSAVYHRGTWSPRLHGLLKRLDHSNIFLIIAGTYTPFALLLLPEGQSRSLMLIAWAGAVAGVLFRVFWVGAPRWLYTPIYVALGWVAVFYLKPLYDAGGAAPRGADRGRRAALHPGRRGLRHPAPQPLTAVVRLPRGLPRLHGRRVRHPLRRRLDGGLRLRRRLSVRPAEWPRRRPRRR